MRECRVQGGLRAIELGQGSGMELFETSDKAAQLRLRLGIGGFIIEGRSRANSAVEKLPAEAAFRSTSALYFAVIGTTNLCVARLIRASYG
jgi:hypothetical protein